jgi:hypothetical protein
MEHVGLSISTRESNEGIREASESLSAKTPTQVRIIGSDISIVQRSAEEMAGNMGEYEMGKASIYVDKNLAFSAMQDTILHEVLHVVLQHFEKDSEQLVRILTPSLLAILKDNPKLVSFLTEGTGFR